MADTANLHDARYETAHALADRAAKTAMGYFRIGVEIVLKGDESPVTVADSQIEQEARDLLKKRFPEHEILGEEFGTGDLTSDHVWVIDPIDGTRSFISGHPLFGFLLAHMVRGVCDMGLISMPALKERFVGRRGQGATLNGAPITTSKCTDLSDAILSINEGEHLIEHESDVLSRLLRVGHTRRFGYDCYPHALVAAG